MVRKNRKSKGRSRGRNSRKMVINRAPRGLPSVFTCKLKYVDFISLNATASVPSFHDYRANSVYHPDYSAVGHQPVGYDRLATAYKHYLVLGSKISVSAYAIQDTGGQPTWMCLQKLHSNTTANGSLRNILENGGSAVRIGPSSATGSYSANNARSGNGVVLRRGYSPKKDLPPHLRGVSSLQALVSGNPTEDFIFRIIAFKPDNLSLDPATIQCRVEMEFFVKFFEEKLEEAENTV